MRAGTTQSAGPAETPWNADDDDASRNSPTSAARRCRITCCGSWSWRSLDAARLRHRAARSSMPSTKTAISPNPWRRSRRPCARSSSADSRGGRGGAGRGAGARSRRCRRAFGRRMHRAAAAAARSRRRPASTLACRSRAITSSWSPTASCRCCAASCVSPKKSWSSAGAGALLPPAPRLHGQRRATPSTWCRMSSCAAPSTAGPSRSIRPPCRACA